MKTILKSIKELTIEITAKKQQLYNKVIYTKLIGKWQSFGIKHIVLGKIIKIIIT